jgi:hypothetical protein
MGSVATVNVLWAVYLECWCAYRRAFVKFDLETRLF